MKNKINLGTKFIAFLALFMFSILAINVSAKAGQMKMHAIYVDRGDAIVIESNGHFMLVDSGISQTSEKVLAYLKSLNIPNKKIDYVISTHPDGDHVGGFPAVFKEYEIGQVIYSPCTKPSKEYLSFIKTVKEKNSNWAMQLWKWFMTVHKVQPIMKPALLCVSHAITSLFS